MEKQIKLGVQAGEDDAYHDPNRSITRQEFRVQRKKEELNGTAIKFLDAELTVQAGQIALKASQSELNATKDRVTTAEATLVVQAGQIATKVSTTQLNTALTNYSTLVQTSDSIELAIGQINVGGKNLLKLSDVAKNNANYNIAVYNLAETLTEGEEVTLSLKGALGADRDSFKFYNSGGSIQIYGADMLPADFNADGIATKTFAWRVAGASNVSLYVYQFTGSDTSNSSIEWIKLERGNKRTDFTVAEAELKGAKYTFDGTNATFTNGGLIIKNNLGVTVFSADVNGNLDIVGKISSDSGAIGGWTIGSNYLQSADGKTGISATGKLSANGVYYALWLASTDTNPQNAVSGFRNSGHFFTSSASIGGWTVNSSSIYKGGVKLDATNERIYVSTSAYLYEYGTSTIGLSGGLRITGTLTVLGNVGALKTGDLNPVSDNTYGLGMSGFRWVDVWAVDTSINSSDIRLKKDIQPIEKGIDLVLKLKPVQYRWIKEGAKRNHYGFIANEVEGVMKELDIDSGVFIDPKKSVTYDPKKDPDGYLSLRYTELIAPMIQTIQNLNQRLQALENKREGYTYGY